jgi:Ser/Thr protein kinase RdoA (MazF antagonist)
VIHNDFILGNCLWQGSRLSVLDFADCGVGLYLYDLAPMLTNLEAPELQDAFLAGYSSKRPLSEGDNQRLPLLQAVRHVRACLVSIAKAQRNEPIPPLEVHLASRMTDIHTLMV